MPQTIYVFSGLGADERVFQDLRFAGFPVSFIQWISPKKREKTENYATRLLAQIQHEKPILIGLSFGGMMAIEVAKQIAVQKVILIASAKTKSEIPPYYRLAGFLKLHKLFPARLLKQSNLLTNWFFGAKTEADKRILKEILKDTDPEFLLWAMTQIVRWENHTIPQNAFHIHGSSDKILPIRFVKCDAVIKGGGHLMTLDKAEEVNAILQQQLW